ncbi:MAG: class I SAM-dependent methyltransferase [Chitinivibrionales bacterium]|nr:class I SAM-dependent methyltransferase [Chitinivibrionales bacterium]
MLVKSINRLCKIAPSLKRILWHSWYNFILSGNRETDLLFMNYGYSGIEPNDSPLSLQPDEEQYRYRIQLYHHVAQAADMTGKEVLEVGCGCGGGAAYIATHFGPAIMKGLDYSQNAIESCRKLHAAVPNLTFVHGDAESLPFEDGSFDIVVNVESSHTYRNPERFFSEVDRVLRPQGYFSFADFRDRREVPKLRQQLRDARFLILREENITRNVVKALELDSDRKMGLIQQGVFKKAFQTFSGTKGSVTYKTFDSGETEYLFFVLQKGGAQ